MNPFQYTFKLIKYAVKKNPLLIASVLLGLFSVLIELMAMTLLIPISTIAGGNEMTQDSLLTKMIKQFGGEPTITVLLLLLFGLLALRILSQLLSQGATLHFGKKIQAQLSSEAFDAIINRCRINEIEEKSIGHFISLSGDEASRASSLIITMTQFISLFFLSILYYLAIFNFSNSTGILVLVFLIITFFSLYGSLKKSHQLGTVQIDQSKKASSIFLDSLNGLRSVRAFNAEDYVVGKYRSSIFEYVHTLFLIDFVSLIARLVPVLILVVFAEILIFYKGNAIKQLGVAFFVTVVIYLMRFFPSVGQCLQVFLRILSDSKVGKDVTEIVSIKYLIDENLKKELKDEVRVIAVKNLNFSYSNGSLIFKDLNLDFIKGSSYAVVGPSGIGKSTLFDLILKYHPVQQGSVTVNGIPISELSSSSLRKKILLLEQDVTIFNDSVMNNVTFGARSDFGEVKRACELACIYDEIMALSGGFKEFINYQGSNLSGGQIQRIGIARALLRTPDVLILDESTNSLDGVTRNKVIQNLLEEYKEKILIFITHDSSLIQEVDHVIDIQKNNLIQTSN
ncbi:MAG: ATP-binding cassette domain-containing protein [Nitrospiria bacterium]